MGHIWRSSGLNYFLCDGKGFDSYQPHYLVEKEVIWHEQNLLYLKQTDFKLPAYMLIAVATGEQSSQAKLYRNSEFHAYKGNPQ